MNLTYKLRIVADTEDDIFIDISISSKSSFLELHNSIIEGFKLGGGEMASFYKSNQNWDKGEEVTLMDMSFSDDENNKPMCMENTELNHILNKDEPKSLYLYDFLNMNIFYIDLVETLETQQDLKPKILNKFGNYELKKGEEENSNFQTKPSFSSEIDDILNEYNEDDFESFDELDEDLY